MPSETVEAQVDTAISQWEAALSDGKVTLIEFLNSFAATLAALYAIVKSVAGDDAAYTSLREYVAKQIDERITPIDLPNVGPFVETNVVDPTIKRVVLGGLDAFRAKIVTVG